MAEGAHGSGEHQTAGLSRGWLAFFVVAAVIAIAGGLRFLTRDEATSTDRIWGIFLLAYGSFALVVSLRGLISQVRARSRRPGENGRPKSTPPIP